MSDTETKEDSNVHFIPFEEHTTTPDTHLPLSSAHEGQYLPHDQQPPKKFDRADVVNAFQSAFLQAGGVQRLVQHAEEDYRDFLKHYAKLLPSGTSSALGETTDIQITHKLPRTKLDM